MVDDVDFIRINNLTKAFKEGNNSRLVLDNLSVNFGRGEFIAILGKSGSGKAPC
jgi:putative ABC transport system ATP-binding protein